VIIFTLGVLTGIFLSEFTGRSLHGYSVVMEAWEWIVGRVRGIL